MRILVLCSGNSCRSQMAHGYLQHMVGPDHLIYSAGVEVRGVDPRAIAVMKEDGIDISHHTSNLVNEYRDLRFDHVITVCDNARETCPWFPSMATKHHRDFPDPAPLAGAGEAVMAEFRVVRDQIKVFCRDFVASNVPA